MMKITAIMGSPRLGDSYKITRMIEDRLKQYGDVEFEYVFLKDRDIGMCRGCFLCVRNGERHCPIKDDVPAILETMRQSDGLIFVSPVYSLSVTGLMKNFKDRVAYNAHRPTFWGKKAMAVVTSEGTGIQGTLEFIKSWSIWGIEFASELGAIVHPTLQPTRRHTDELEKRLDKAVAAFHTSLLTSAPLRPKLMQVVQFRMLKTMSELAKDGFPADYAFYEGKQKYYFETPVGFMQDLISRMFARFIAGFMRKNYQITG